MCEYFCIDFIDFMLKDIPIYFLLTNMKSMIKYY